MSGQQAPRARFAAEIRDGSRKCRVGDSGGANKAQKSTWLQLLGCLHQWLLPPKHQEPLSHSKPLFTPSFNEPVRFFPRASHQHTQIEPDSQHTALICPRITAPSRPEENHSTTPVSSFNTQTSPRAYTAQRIWSSSLPR